MTRLFQKMSCLLPVLGLLLGSMRQLATAQTNGVATIPDIQAVAAGNNGFALDLYGHMPVEGNVCFSPYSISAALAMATAGARGETRQQMTQALRLNLPADRLAPAFAAVEAELDAVQQKGQVKLTVANSLWPQKGFAFLPDYLALCDRYYGASIVFVDYGQPAIASQIINNWVADKTQGKITDLISPDAVAGAKLTLVNAIYFRGDWASPFKASLTEQEPFHLSSGDTVTASLMHQTSRFGYADFSSLQVLELPYAGGDVSMVVLLPRDTNSLDQLEAGLPGNLAAWTTNLVRQSVNVYLPKFKAASQFSLAQTLAVLGMTDAFGAQADFSGMDGGHDLFISDVVHKAYVDVYEKGTEAAAATGVTMMRLALERPITPPPVFRADHPFLFLIRDNHTGSILFLGRVMNPAD